MDGRKQAAWCIHFLRALVRTGDVRAAAADAGVDELTAYQERRDNPRFAGLWRGALRAHSYWKGLQENRGDGFSLQELIALERMDDLW